MLAPLSRSPSSGLTTPGCPRAPKPPPLRRPLLRFGSNARRPPEGGRRPTPHRPQALRKSFTLSAMSVSSQGKPACSRPKWP